MNRNQVGFTLVEMVIVVIIIGTIAAFAIPTYQNTVNRTYRSDAQAALIALASAMERRYTENNNYCDGGNDAAILNCGDAATADTGNPQFFPHRIPREAVSDAEAVYLLEISQVNAGTFEVSAVAVNPGRMADDECGDFTYTYAGVKDVVNQDVGITMEDCWVN